VLVGDAWAGMELTKLKGLIAADCPNLENVSFFQRCGVHFPGVSLVARPSDTPLGV
jgi:hypothetical protein